MITDLQINGFTVSYSFEGFECQYEVLNVPEYFSLLRMLEAEAREVHESRFIDDVEPKVDWNGWPYSAEFDKDGDY